MVSLSRWMGYGVIKDFPFEIGEVVQSGPQRGHWTLKRGTKHEDNSEVSIFEFDKKRPSSDEVELAENGWRKAKTLMLPGFLKCIGSGETQTHLYLATEPVKPLHVVLASDADFTEGGKKREEFVAWGLHQIVKGLGHIHQRNTLHGNISRYSIFVTRSGDWRLWGLDWVTNLSDPTQQDHFKRFSNYLGDEYKSPELEKGNWGVIESSPVHAVDAWGLACLIYEVFNGTLTPDTKPSDMKSASSIPRSLYGAYTGLLAAQAKMRTDPAKLLTDCEFFCASTYICVQLELEELSLKDQAERDSFFRRLAGHVDDFPLANCKYTILPRLTTALQFGSGGSSALEPILRIGSRLGHEEYTELVVPGVVSLFTSPEPIVRMKLLQNIDAFAQHLPRQMLNDTIWPHLATGFANKVPEIRELTIKAMIPVVPLLKPQLVEEAAKMLFNLQTDREGGIRTNATICLGKVSTHIPLSSRSKTLLQAFGRVLKDPFKPSRMAGLGSFAASSEHFTPETMARQILPNITPLTVDPERDVRLAAFRCIGTLLKKVEEWHENPEQFVAQQQPTAQEKPEEKADGWGGWAASAISGRFRSEEKQSTPSRQDSSLPSQSESPIRPVEKKVPPPVVSDSFDKKPVRDDDADGWGEDDFDDIDEPAPKVVAPPPQRPASSGMQLGAKPKKKGLGGGVKKLD